MKYKSEDIDLLIDSLKIEEVVGEFVELKKSGANYKGLCPFHPDTTPSFMVSPSKNICKCFVCGAGGNPVSFYSRYKKISFGEAVEELAKKYNIQIQGKKEDKKESEEYKKYYEIMNEAHNFYKENIFSVQGRVALEYLSKRKVTPQLIKENEIGYASSKWSELGDYLISKGYKGQDLKILGLVKERDNGNIYDAFRNRIIFPIYSAKKEIIAFGGRTLETDKEVPKYINSPDTPIFKKGKNLYGLERSGIIRKKNYAMLMEGYMDVISAYTYGFDVAVAPLGTALTYEQGELLKRYSGNIILALDSDSPGQVATERAGIILKSLGFNIRVLELTGAKDPDEYLKTYGKESFLKCVRDSVEIFDFLFKFYSKEYDFSNIISKQNFITRFKDFFQAVETDLEKTLYLDKLSKAVDIDRDVLHETLIDKNRKKSRKFEKDLVNIDSEGKNSSLDRLERDTLCLIMARKEYFDYFKDKKIKSSFGKKVFKFLGEKRSQEDYDILTKEELTEEEKDEFNLLRCDMIELYTQEEKMEEIFLESYISWFKKEIDQSYISIKSGFFKDRELGLIEKIDLAKSIKIVEIELGKARDFKQVEELYEEFKKIVKV